MVGESVWDEPGTEAFWVNAKQMAGIYEDVVAIRLPRNAVPAELKKDPRLVRRRPGSDWIEVAVTDSSLILDLVELAAACYRAAPGVAAKPPPTGADLERRRRWH